MRRWSAVLLPGVALYFLPVPGLNPAQRHLLSIFLATIVSLVAQPVPMGVSVLTGMTLLALTGTVAPAKVLSGFSNQTTWLIVSAFLFSRAVTQTGIGMRIAYMFVRQFGRSALSLAYSIVASNVILAPFIPSDTGRGGAIIYPITQGLAKALGSEPGPTGRSGAFITLVGFHTNYIASALFLTSMAANPLIADFAAKIAHVDLSWGRWALATVVPGFLSLTIVPYVIFRLHPPESSDVSAARALASRELDLMGRLSRNERWLVVVLLGVMGGWVFSPWLGVPNAFVALSGISALLILKVFAWADLLGESRAWDALMWFAPLLMMSDVLNESGTVKILSSATFARLDGWPWEAALCALVLLYLYVHYAFASMTAHATALYPGFLTAAVAAGAPPMQAALALA
ncbi:MAG: DASS family sodium-coupled anion symporter, partial [Bryobacteraceae bacterium]